MDADRRYKHDWYLLQRQARRQRPPVPVVELTPHLNAVLGSGKTRKEIAAEAGVSYEVVMHVLAGNRVRVLAGTADRLRAVQPHPYTPVGLARRVQALAFLGWSPEALAARSGGVLVADDLERLAAGGGWLPHTEKAAAVMALTRALWRTPGPCERTRARARQRGWVSLLAWDDGDAIDRPESRPSGLARAA